MGPWGRLSLLQGHGWSAPALSWFWDVTHLVWKPSVSELKGATESKCPIPVKLQMRKLRQGHTASQREHQDRSPRLPPSWRVHGGTSGRNRKGPSCPLRLPRPGFLHQVNIFSVSLVAAASCPPAVEDGR